MPGIGRHPMGPTIKVFLKLWRGSVSRFSLAGDPFNNFWIRNYAILERRNPTDPPDNGPTGPHIIGIV